MIERTKPHPDTLPGEWNQLAGPEAAQYGRDLIARYREPHRHYHTVEHLVAMLRLLDLFDKQAHDPTAVRYAAWFHDAVYDVGGDPRRSNEERSARLAENVLKALHATGALIAETGRLVRLTATHRPEPDDANGAVLCDADLAILGAEPAEYRRYRAQIREEYRRYNDEEFRAGRATVLRALLEHPTIFRTGDARELFEEPARRNLEEELEELTVPA